jgi:hypothetical protein
VCAELYEDLCDSSYVAPSDLKLEVSDHLYAPYTLSQGKVLPVPTQYSFHTDLDTVVTQSPLLLLGKENRFSGRPARSLVVILTENIPALSYSIFMLSYISVI